MRFYKYDWIPYFDNRMKIPEIKQKQVSRLFYTGLCEGQIGKEYTFFPTRTISDLHKSVVSLYSKIKTVNHKVELCDEIFYTTKIEGSNTTYQRTVEIHDGSPVDYSNYFSELMVQNGFKATKFMNSYANELTEDILLQMWNILMDGCCQNECIRGDKYRIGEVQVGNHTGIYSGILEDVMTYWINFYNSDDLDDFPFIKASLLHVSYEMIHPFCDGNGRSGRLLMINYLISRGYEKCKAVSFSKRLAEELRGYYYNLDLCDNSYGDCTPFIEYMLSIFINTFEDINNKRRGEHRFVHYSKKSNSYYITVKKQNYIVDNNNILHDKDNINYVIINGKRYNLLYK